eukprot:SAG11_NODE_1300_length_5261_cov_8.900232_6_plen_138_part_00
MGLHPNLLGCVRQLLGVANVDELRLLQHTVTAKFGFPATPTDADAKEEPGSKHGWGEEAAGEQPLHQDFGNNTLLTPARGAINGVEHEAAVDRWLPVEELQAIVYYIEGSVGPTAFVPGLRHATPPDGRQELRPRYR